MAETDHSKTPRQRLIDDMLDSLVFHLQRKTNDFDVVNWLHKAEHEEGGEKWPIIAVASPNQAPDFLVNPLINAGMSEINAVSATAVVMNIRLAEHLAKHGDWEDSTINMTFAGLYLGSLIGGENTAQLINSRHSPQPEKTEALKRIGEEYRRRVACGQTHDSEGRAWMGKGTAATCLSVQFKQHAVHWKDQTAFRDAIAKELQKPEYPTIQVARVVRARSN